MNLDSDAGGIYRHHSTEERADELPEAPDLATEVPLDLRPATQVSVSQRKGGQSRGQLGFSKLRGRKVRSKAQVSVSQGKKGGAGFLLIKRKGRRRGQSGFCKSRGGKIHGKGTQVSVSHGE